MKILSYQFFSVYGNGGGSRILRRLYEGHEPEITSLAQEVYAPSRPIVGPVKEKIITLTPLLRGWMRWKLRKWAIRLREGLFKKSNVKAIRKGAAGIPFDVMHVVDHGVLSSVLCYDSFLSGKKLWVSFHDHFSTTGGAFDNTKKLWDCANRRLVISQELGDEYNRIFGERGFEILTDGVLPEEISEPVKADKSEISIYFAGLLHFDYLPLFKTLADSLDILSKEGFKIKLILRGTHSVDFLNGRGFKVEYRPFSLNHNELKEELNAATILYLPIKFEVPDFYLYSLSTKMIGYLGAAGSILYHGPADSAASNLLKKSGSAIGCYTLETKDMLDSFHAILDEDCKVSLNAKRLASEHFNLHEIRNRFWQSKPVIDVKAEPIETTTLNKI